MSVITLKNISVYFPDVGKPALKDVNWDIKSGEKWVLFGPNGSGKTKLLEVIMGYHSASSGSVRRFGRCPRGNDVRKFRSFVGYAAPRLMRRFSGNEKALDIVMSGLYGTIGLYEEPSREEEAHGMELLRLAGLSGREKDRLVTFSEGEREKICIARALVKSPRLVLLDEPAMGLDMEAREDLLEAIESLCSGNDTAVVYVTHHLEEVIALFRNIFILNEGACLYQGNIRKALEGDLLKGIFSRPFEIMEKHGRYYALML